MGEIQVVKRSGVKEPLDYEKINNVLLWACEGLNNVTASDVAMNAHLQLYDGISTDEIHQVIIQSAADMISEKTPNYQYVASNLVNFFIRKKIFGVQDNLPHLEEVINRNIKKGVYDPTILENYTSKEIHQINKLIRHQRDYNFVYAGLQQLIDKYLLKDRKTGEIFETPQYMYIMISMVLFSNYKGKERLSKIKSFYNDISLFKISLPTPIMAGVRTPTRQYSSCTLIDVGDTIDSIYNSNTAIGKYTARRAGIGINLRVRAAGDTIRNGEVIHTGVVPFLKMFESTVKSCTQNGIRGGSATVYMPFWHKEIRDVLVLKNNKGTDDNRVRKLDYGIQFCRLFYNRFVKNQNITLFSPADVPDLYESFGIDNERFEKLYVKYENDKNISKKTVKSRDLFNQFIQERIGTGRMYVMNIDHANDHSSFKDKIYMSNLCVDGDTKIKIRTIDTDNEINLKYNLTLSNDGFYYGELKIKDVVELFNSTYIESYQFDDKVVMRSHGKIEALSMNTETNDDQYKSIVKAAMTGEDKETIEVYDDVNNIRLICTPDHPIYTLNRGYVKAIELNEDDQLSVFNNELILMS